MPRLILDIGTHKVLGLAVQPTAEGVRILASARRTHGSRAMRDGQVHDVPAVAETVRAVVEEIERALATDGPGPDRRPGAFTEAYIAAAGRALQTTTGRTERTEVRPVAVTDEMERALEWDAVADAQARLLAALPEEERTKGFYCIAHTVTERRIDGEPIASLVEQRGSSFAVAVLATFLPGVVVDSLEAALRHAGLEMKGLTLEPVAALEAVVPESMRHLRLLLIDVGAGTTDIAYAGDGAVQAYGMAPMGGDAMTEALARVHLLDFNVAEKAKRRAATGRVAVVSNVLGDDVEIDEAALLAAVEPAATRLAAAVGQLAGPWTREVRPDAVLLVGGGSRTPRLPARLAEELDVPPERVSIRDRRAVAGAVGDEGLQGPDVVTALGIALRFARGQDAPPVRVRVNGRPVSLFQPERCTVREAARIAGLPLSRLVGRFGQGMTVTVNDELFVIPGRRGESAAARVNDEPAGLDTPLQMYDDVHIELPEEGDAARATVRDVARLWLQRQKETSGRDGPRVAWNGSWRDLPLLAERDGQPVSWDDTVSDRDVFEFRRPSTIRELIGTEAFAADVEQPFSIVLDGEPVTVRLPAELRLNGAPVGLSARIEDGDQIQMGVKDGVPLYELLSRPEIGALRRMSDGLAAGTQAGSPASPRRLVLHVRGEPAGFTTVVRAGDAVDIRYE